MPARLQRLTLRNFKSFRSAVIPFAPGFTAIMGPNGSGKSNIIDAIIFVLGEGRLKLIRASRLTDLVYHKARDGKAVVSLDIEGPDGESYQITREIDRKGHSVYRLNGKRTTRAAILEKLASVGISPNGYNIVLQGDITRVVKMTPKERRTIIDEVSGVAEYEEKKEEALKELESVEEKIKDAELILGERKAVLEKLKADRDAALRYKALKEELRSLRKSILLKRRDDLLRSLERVKSRLEDVERRISEIDAEIESKEREKQELDGKISEINEEIREIYSKIGEGFLESVREELTRKQAELESAQSELERIKDEIIELTNKREKLLLDRQYLEEEFQRIAQRKAEKEAELERVKAEVDALVQKINEIESQNKSLESELVEIERLLDEKQRRFIELREEHSRLNAEYNTRREMNKKQEALLEKIRRAREELESISKELSELEQRKKELFEVEKSLNKRYLELSEEIKALREEVGSYRGAASALKSLGVDVEVLNALKQAQSRGELYGIHDFVFNLIKYDRKYAAAIETAAGRRLFYIVVDTADAAAEAIKYLKKHNLGRATFIPMDRVSIRLVDVPHSGGVLGRALDFVRYDEKYARAMAYVFGDTVVVDTIDNAKVLAGKYRAVTLDGDVVERSGIMSGGAKRSGVSLLQVLSVESKRRELSEKEAESKEIVAKLQEIRDRVRDISSKISALRARESELKKLVESAPLEAEDILARIQERILEVEREMEEIANEISELEMRKSKIKTDMRKTGDRDTVALFERLSSLRQEQDVLSRELNEIVLVYKEKEERMRYIEEKVAEISQRLDKLAERRDSLQITIAALQEEISELEKKLLEAERRSAEVRDRLESLHAKKDALEAELHALLERLGTLSKERESLIREQLQLDAKRSALESNISELDSDLREYVDVEPLQELPENPERRLSEILDEMRSLEPVNMRAIEEYEEMRAKIEEVEERISKLREEKAAILDLMAEIEKKKEKAFMDAFLAIRKRFREVYRELENGSADLRLTDESDIFNSGLIIEAQPKGKTLKNIDAMSGGEKAMVAIAFILAIALYQPSAFYILDEPDQALDKKNAEKVAKFIKRLSKSTQFIVVSHRDVVLKEADQIIGVYMKDDGSSAVEIKLNPLPASS